MGRRAVALAIEFRIVRLVLLGHIVDSGEQHPGDGNNRFFVTTALFESKVATTDL